MPSLETEALETLTRVVAGYEGKGRLVVSTAVAVRRADCKRIIHVEFGVLDLLCEVLMGADGDLQLVVLFAHQARTRRHKLGLLRGIDTQHLATARSGS